MHLPSTSEGWASLGTSSHLAPRAHSWWPLVPETPWALRVLACLQCGSQKAAAFRVQWNSTDSFRHLFFFFWRTQFHTKNQSWQKQPGRFQPKDVALENSQLQISKQVRKGALWISSQFEVYPPNNLLTSWAHQSLQVLLYGTGQFSRETLQYASRPKAWARTQAPEGKTGCEGTGLHLLCPSCPAKFSPSSPDAEQLTPTHGGETHCGARAGGGTVTIEKLRHCQPTPLLFSLRRVCVTIPTCSEPRGSGGRRCLQHIEHVMKPSQTFCSAVTTTCYLCCFQHKSKP